MLVLQAECSVRTCSRCPSQSSASATLVECVIRVVSSGRRLNAAVLAAGHQQRATPAVFTETNKNKLARPLHRRRASFTEADVLKTVARWPLFVPRLHTCSATGRHVFALALRLGAFTRSLARMWGPRTATLGSGVWRSDLHLKAAGKVPTVFHAV